MRTDTRGFSLIELLIVVAIILILAAIAIPNLLRSKISANEASAVASVRAITTAQVAYAQMYSSIGYADTLTKLGAPASGSSITPSNAGLLDWVLGCTSQPCQKSGYNFSISNTTGPPIFTYTVNGTPVVQGSTGVRGFCSGTRMNITVDPAGGTSCTQELQ
jgi:type IV pilus assembly protein PilA